MLEAIQAELERTGGWMSFARYMELALHAPGAGYYAGGARKFGAEGDFVTAPELGSLFARTLARQLKAVLRPGEAILEVGAGSGALASQLTALLDCEYWILETSAELRGRQEARLQTRVRWLDRLPARFRGVVLANEVLDAMPVHAVAWRDGGIFERGVAVRDGALHWAERPAGGDLLLQAQALAVPRPYESEIGLIGQAWVRALAESLERGAAFIIDYGFPRHEYYHPQRSAGTLMCHHRHSAHADVFLRPGMEDLTAHVDFSALAAAARRAGLEVLGYATQAQFLVNCGITDVLGEANVENALHYAPLAAEANRLLSPAEMGELFKVLALGRGVERPLLGYTRNDRSHTL
ncbi:MAG TPA: SAM-dependent methyltransferase [Burkholderiales bacterium]|nr:SAM-dependent methyltransferase [Burkholderiales bacterium]